MTGRVVVMQPDAYAQWLAGGNQIANVPIRGRELFIRYGCAGCHGPNSQVHAPPLEGVYRRLQPVENQQFVEADAAYLRDSILLPSQHVVAGYPNVIPSFQGVIPEGELLDLIEYLKSIGSAPPVASPDSPRPGLDESPVNSTSQSTDIPSP